MADKVLPITRSKRYVSGRLKAAVAGVEQMVAGQTIMSPQDPKAQSEILYAVFMANLKEHGGAASAKALRPAWEVLRRKLTEAQFSPAVVKDTIGRIDEFMAMTEIWE